MCFQKCDINVIFLSKMMHYGMPNTLSTCYKNMSATLGAVMLSCTGVRTIHLAALSTIVMILLNPCNIGRPNTKSIA